MIIPSFGLRCDNVNLAHPTDFGCSFQGEVRTIDIIVQVYYVIRRTFEIFKILLVYEYVCVYPKFSMSTP